jgi:hypothetical protein
VVGGALVATAGLALLRPWAPVADDCEPVAPASSWSIARRWNEALLDAIRRDLPAPTVHARNLFHVSAAMWDAWAAYDDAATGFFVDEQHTARDVDAARTEAMDLLDGDSTILQWLEERFPKAGQAPLRALAGCFGFSGDDVEKRMPSQLIRFLHDGEILTGDLPHPLRHTSARSTRSRSTT